MKRYLRIFDVAFLACGAAAVWLIFKAIDLAEAESREQDARRGA